MFSFIIRYLTFHATHEDLTQLNQRHLFVGLIGTWIVGFGRYWDHPDAEFLQYIGLGSVIYVFCLAALFWIIIKGMYVPECRYFDLLVMICLTSFPAVLYAIPVEQFMSMQHAISANVWFLAIVAIWRVALFFCYLYGRYRIGIWATLLVMLVPLMAIVFSLAMLNLEHVVFNIMGGFHEPSPNDGAYTVVFLLTILSFYASIPIIIAYAITAILRWVAYFKEKRARAE